MLQKEEVESQLLAIVRVVGELRHVSLSDRLEDLGVDSVARLGIVGEIERAYRVNLDLEHAGEIPIQVIADYIVDTQASPSPKPFADYLGL